MKNSKKVVGESREFERIRRITGYLTGTVDGWNNAKRAEEKDRVRHPVIPKKEGVSRKMVRGPPVSKKAPREMEVVLFSP